MSKITKAGIVPTADLFYTENQYDDKYHFPDTYVVRAIEAGMLPVGILPAGGRITTDILDECDCFIICGGKHIWPFQVQVVEHAVKTGKKLIGICLGHQSVHTYFKVAEEAEKRGYNGPAADLYEEMCRDGFRFLKEVEGHRAPLLPRGDKESTKHKVILKEGSRISRILSGRTEIMGASLHSFQVFDVAPGVEISGMSEDGIIEAIEYGDNIIGTQFHPDVDDKLHELFDWLKE